MPGYLVQTVLSILFLGWALATIVCPDGFGLSVCGGGHSWTCTGHTSSQQKYQSRTKSETDMVGTFRRANLYKPCRDAIHFKKEDQTGSLQSENVRAHFPLCSRC